MFTNSKPTLYRNTTRVLVLKPMEGKTPKSTTGSLDARLFTGENKLNAILDPRTRLWYLKYSAGGGLQEPLKQKFTSFEALLKHVTDYFLKRNVQITEIID